jgi:hypothetical protein
MPINRTEGWGNDKLHLTANGVKKGDDHDSWKDRADVMESLKCICAVVSNLCDEVDKIPEPEGRVIDSELHQRVKTLEENLGEISSSIGRTH